MVELLAVIAIIILLMGMLLLGMNYMARMNKVHATEGMMENLRSMLTELRNDTVSWNTLPTGSIPANAVNITQTQTVMKMLLTMPNNNQALKRLPADRLMKNTDPPVLLDGWDNSIIFVPAGGLTGVTKGGNSTNIASPDGQPFWASAGPDKDWTKGDDNIYSTGK